MTDVTTSAGDYRGLPDDGGAAHNQKKIFFASFMTLVAAGMESSFAGYRELAARPAGRARR